MTSHRDQWVTVVSFCSLFIATSPLLCGSVTFAQQTEPATGEGSPFGTPPIGGPAAPENQIEIIQLKHLPATDVAQLLIATLGIANSDRQPGAVITAEPASNSLAVNAPAPVYRLIERLINDLDKRQPSILLEITLLQPNGEGDQQGGLPSAIQGRILSESEVNRFREAAGRASSAAVLARPKLVLLNNQPGFLRLAKRADGSELALTVGATARATSEGFITVELDLEVPNAEDETVSLQTTLSLPSGHGVVVGDVGIDDQASRPGLVMFASVKILDVAE